jgi:hypothetical protein
MLLDAIGGALPMAVGVALSPLPIAAILIILMTSRAASNAPAFLLGWVAGILVIGSVVFLMPGLLTARGDPTRLSGMIRIVLGIALLLLSLQQWRRRPAPGTPVEVPRMLSRLDSIGAVKSSMTGFLLAAVHPKNTVLNVAGAVAIDAVTRDSATQYLALVIFAFIASIGIVAPVGAFFIARRKAVTMLGHGKDWLIRNNVNVLMILLLAFGALLVARGIHILSAA